MIIHPSIYTPSIPLTLPYPTPAIPSPCLTIDADDDHSYHATIPGLDILLHLHSNLPVMFDHPLLMLLAVEVLASRLGGAVLEEDAAVLAVKLLAHNYNRL